MHKLLTKWMSLFHCEVVTGSTPQRRLGLAGAAAGWAGQHGHRKQTV